MCFSQKSISRLEVRPNSITYYALCITPKHITILWSHLCIIAPASLVEKRVYGPRKDIFFYLFSDAQYSLKFPAEVVPTPLFLPFYVIMTSFLQELTKQFALLTFTLIVLTYFMVRPEFPNLEENKCMLQRTV